jgi:hypothetical protein
LCSEGSDNLRDPKEGGQGNSARKETMAIDRQVVYSTHYC